MSLTVPEQRRIWLPVAAGAAMLAIITTASLLSVADREKGESSSAPETYSTLAIDQAPWKIKVYPAAALGKATRKQRARVDAHRKPLTKLIREVYTAMFLSPGELAGVIDHRFTKHAATALRRSGAGLPNNALVVETTTRKASVSVDASAARQAAATVTVEFNATIDGEPLRIGHRATLWLQREGRRWSVLAFDVRQGELVPRDANGGSKDRHDRKGGGKDRHDRKGGGKDRKAST